MAEPTHPLGPDAPTEDYVGLAFGALAFSAALGVALNAAVGFVVRTIQASSPEQQTLNLGGADAMVLLLGTLLACMASAIATWRIMNPARNTFRQGMLAMVSFFAAFVLSMLSMPVDRAFGRAGLGALAAVGLVACLLIGRRIGQAG
ncbi:MAG: hypothetical protein AB7S39_05970 [Gemmatimonadales bacterium]